MLLGVLEKPELPLVMLNLGGRLGLGGKEGPCPGWEQKGNRRAQQVIGPGQKSAEKLETSDSSMTYLNRARPT